ncbi:hypothetical protein UA08_06366 [Talaromyces atroroseus]|uniref:Major facilitator superfamily (MFS) profile domain-containing protein n=1 Tax=Talaromyces atroroseus TaxID=1441469 RepID=A0A225AVB7_TALAT|nr:hypothetical protein UA08_06366 [Talaromyces atroroseus]OKL58375.1 hypothetical protein UA08_06366 [Talaromyces atroroseus]
MPGNSDTADAIESSPLLRSSDDIRSRTDEGIHATAEANDAKWTGGAIRTACLAAAVLVLYAFADVLRYTSTVRLIEVGVCREHHPEIDLHEAPAAEDPCKSPPVQQELARLRGYLSALEAIVGLLLTLPYGLLVGRLGEPLLAGVNIVGYLLSCAWLIIVCFYYNAFPIWIVVLSPLWRVLGGGTPFLASVIYSLVTKHVPAANRSLCFFLFMAAQLWTEIVAIMLAATLLEHEYLFTLMMLNFPLGLLCLITIFMLRLDNNRSASADVEDELDNEPVDLVSSIRRSLRILPQLLHDRYIVVLLSTVPVAKLLNPIMELMFQYIPRKFGLSLAWTSRLISMQALESMIFLVALLPLAKRIAQTRFHLSPIKVDLSIAQYGFLVMIVGCLIMAFAQSLIIFILGFLIFITGLSTRPALQAVLADLVSPEHVAVLYTMMAVGDGIGSAAGALILNRSLAVAIGWDDKIYLGLPFLIAAVCFMLGFVGSIFANRALRPRLSI